MRVLIITLIITQYIYSKSINLKSLIDNIENIRLIDKSIKEESLSLDAKSKSETSDEPFVVKHSMSQIGTTIDSMDYGIDISLSKEIKLGDIQKLEAMESSLKNQAYIIKKGFDSIKLKNSIGFLYHQYCIGEEYLSSYRLFYSNLEELYRKKQIAYRSEDIAKTELLQVELEKNRHSTKLNNIIRKQNSAKEQLLIFGNFNISDRLSCTDLSPIIDSINLKDNLFSISNSSYEKMQNSLRVAIDRYSKKLESINISIGYNYEVDTNFYTLGVEIPLNFTTEKNEYKRVSIMHKMSALEIEHQRFIKERLYQLKLLEVNLNNSVKSIIAIKNNIMDFKERLLPLIKKSYAYGESTVTEYLLTQQRLNILERELLEEKIDYYNSLFKIYTITEQENI